MVGKTLDWKDELGRWLKPFLDRLGHKARRRMCLHGQDPSRTWVAVSCCNARPWTRCQTCYTWSVIL